MTVTKAKLGGSPTQWADVCRRSVASTLVGLGLLFSQGVAAQLAPVEIGVVDGGERTALAPLGIAIGGTPATVRCVYPDYILGYQDFGYTYYVEGDQPAQPIAGTSVDLWINPGLFEDMTAGTNATEMYLQPELRKFDFGTNKWVKVRSGNWFHTGYVGISWYTLPCQGCRWRPAWTIDFTGNPALSSLQNIVSNNVVWRFAVPRGRHYAVSVKVMIRYPSGWWGPSHSMWIPFGAYLKSTPHDFRVVAHAVDHCYFQ